MPIEDAPEEVPQEHQHHEVNMPVAESTDTDTAQGIGEATVERISDKPPIYGGYIGLDPSVDKVTGQTKLREEEPSSRMEDPDKAEALAMASDDFRTKAVKNRALESGESDAEMSAAWAEFKDAASQPTPPLTRPFARHRYWKNWKDKEQTVQESNIGYRERRMRAYEDTYQEAEDDLRPLQSEWLPPTEAWQRASIYDEAAEWIEVYAQILYERPPSEAFRKAYPGIEITPLSLYRMSNETHKLNERIRKLEQKFDTNFMYENQEEDVSLLMSLGSEEQQTRWKGAVAALNQAKRERANIEAEVAKDNLIDPLRQEIKETSDFLNDILSGRATDENYSFVRREEERRRTKEAMLKKPVPPDGSIFARVESAKSERSGDTED